MTDKKKVDFDALQADSPPARSLTLFGRDLSQMPCFRNSFLYGISLGMAVGFLAFMKTSRPQMSTHIGFGTFVGTTLCYWFPYNWSKQQREADMLQHLMQQQAMYEGSAKERELDQKAERA
ncbi:hypothetical protein pipiens_002318 [Culex pipiens pipiens]|uniref:Cytochrome c oxidase assembly protein COX20, mitochondrial n=1 Tax=Culex pipiens pipiens TaxID=38569 RepID=A0ABD1DKH0_CULPP